VVSKAAAKKAAAKKAGRRAVNTVDNLLNDSVR
jgi:hypothetical protein